VVVALPPVGRAVKAGDVLMELDANVEQLAKNEAEARLNPASAQLHSLKQQLDAEQHALEEDRRGAEAAVAQSRAAAEQAVSAAQFAVEEAGRLATLHARGLVSELDALRAKKVAEEQQAQARAAEAAAQLATRDRGTQQQDRVARIASLSAAMAALEGTREEVVAASARLGYEIERRQIRAPISGTLAEVSSLRVGSVVKPGDRIATLVPPGGLKVVALFQPADAVGRVQVGQNARVRFEGFPWTQYGSTAAHVIGVASEVRDGTIRAELSLDAGQASLIPLQHGLPAEVDVEVERLSPAGMVLRTVGRQLLLSGVRTHS
jgi:membrane fusion protein (multidrug efflux system)